MDSPTLNAQISAVQISSVAKEAGISSAPVAGAGTSSSTTSTPIAAPQEGHSSSPVSAEQLQQSIQKLQDKVAKSQSSFSLEAGLDPNGNHPNQVLIKLSDTVTKQVFFSYYVPADQVTKAADSENPMGLLLQSKA
ncbi:hypothetical protein ACQAYK_04715 [Acidithiobacillus sp. AC3]